MALPPPKSLRQAYDYWRDQEVSSVRHGQTVRASDLSFGENGLVQNGCVLSPSSCRGGKFAGGPARNRSVETDVHSVSLVVGEGRLVQ